MQLDYLEKWELRHAAMDRVLRHSELMDRFSSVNISAYTAASVTLQSIDWDRLIPAIEATSTWDLPGIVKQIESLNRVSELLEPYVAAAERITPSVISSITGIASAARETAQMVDIPGIWESLSVYQRMEEQMLRSSRALESFGTAEAAWARALDRIYAEDLDLSPISEEEFEETVARPEIKEALSDLNASPVVGQDTLAQIFSMLEQNKRELDEIKAQNAELLAANKAMAEDLKTVKENTRKKSLVLRFLAFMVMLIIQQFVAQAVDDVIVKPVKEAITSARQGIHMQLRESDPELSKLICRTCMMTAHPNVILRSTHGERSAPSAYLPFGRVVQVLGSYKKWRLVNYISGAGNSYLGWTQNWKLITL